MQLRAWPLGRTQPGGDTRGRSLEQAGAQFSGGRYAPGSGTPVNMLADGLVQPLAGLFHAIMQRIERAIALAEARNATRGLCLLQAGGLASQSRHALTAFKTVSNASEAY